MCKYTHIYIYILVFTARVRSAKFVYISNFKYSTYMYSARLYET